MKLERRVSRMEANRPAQRVGRVLLSGIDASDMTDAERDAWIEAEAARLGVGPDDMHIVLTSPSVDEQKYLRERRQATACDSSCE